MCVLHKIHITKGQDAHSQRITLLCISYLTENENHADIVPFKDSEMLRSCCTSKESPNAGSMPDSPARQPGNILPVRPVLAAASLCPADKKLPCDV